MTDSEAAADVPERVTGFVEEKVYPLEPTFLRQGFGAVLPRLEELRAEVKALGLWAPQLPTELGGMGLSLVEFAEVAGRLGRSPLGHFVFNCQAPDAGNLEILREFGSSEQKERYLQPLATGQIRSCFAMTEPARPGSNPVWMDATAQRQGDSYVVDGRKWFASSAEGAAFAVVMAITDAEASLHQRASMLIVPTDTPGYRLVRNIPVMGEVGQGWASHGEVELRGCKVPVTNLLGEEGEGFAIAQARLGPGRIHHCMRWIGIAERAFDLLCRRATDRQLAPGSPLGSRQSVQHWIADSRAEIAAARLLVADTARKVDREGSRAAREEISMIKYFTAGVMERVLDRAIQAHGALGVTDDLPLAYLWRHERGARIYDGPDEVHREVVARRVLKRYGLNSRPS